MCFLSNLNIIVHVYGVGEDNIHVFTRVTLQGHSIVLSMTFNQRLPYQGATVVEQARSTVQYNEKEHIPRGIMGNFSKKISERTYIALDSLADLVVQGSGALLWTAVLMNLT